MSVLQTTKATLDEPSSGPVTLMTLPPEIRNQIYMLVLGSRDIRTTVLVPLSASEFRDRQERNRDYSVSNVEEFCELPWSLDEFWNKSNLNILLACKQIYIEAFHVFYTSNRFYFLDTELLFSFLKGIGHNRRQYLTTIAFDWCGPFAKEAFELLKTCRRLKCVQFTIPCSDPPGYGAVREVRGLEQALVLERHHYVDEMEYSCLCGRDPFQYRKEKSDDVQELERAMMRPRLKQYAVDSSEKLILFKGNARS